MALETATYIHQLNAANPSGADRLKDGDDHIRMIKAALKATFPGITGPLSASVTHTLLNSLAASAVPIGAIMLWSGLAADVPTGWAICDGRTASKSSGVGTVVTPNLAGFVPMGVTSDHALGATFGQFSKGINTESAGSHTHAAETASAGAHTHSGATGGHALTVDELAAHSHGNGVTDDNVGPNRFPYGTKATTGSGPTIQDSSSGSGTIQGVTESIGGSAAHTHPISSDGAHTHAMTVPSAGAHYHAATIDTSQPTYPIFFIMKV